MNSRKPALASIAFMLAASSFAHAQDLRQIDDSYSVAQRFEQNREAYPDLEWPTLSFEAGQSVRFNMMYKAIENRRLLVDIFQPPHDHQNGMAVMLVHGGGWRSGDKSNFYLLANHLAQRGYVVFLPQYRLSPEALYPAGLTDVNDAIAWAKTQADELGFQPDQLILGGASSGGHMASLLAFTANEPLYKSSPGMDTRVMALVDLDGVLDFTDPLAIRFENALKDKSAAGLWLGGALEDRRETWEEASPARHVDRCSPPTLIISSGQQRFTAGHEAVQAQLDEYGIANRFFSHPEILHTFWLFEPWASDAATQIDGFAHQVVDAKPARSKKAVHP